MSQGPDQLYRSSYKGPESARSNLLQRWCPSCSWEEGGLKIRASVVAVVAALSSLIVVPAASAAGEACYSVSVVVNGDAVVNEAGCQTLP
jgi:hypothetical protein